MTKFRELIDTIVQLEDDYELSQEQVGRWAIDFVHCFDAPHKVTEILLKAAIVNFLERNEGGAEQFLFAVNRAFNVVEEVENGNAN